MFSEDGYLGCPCGVQSLRALNEKLNAEVLERVNDTQELVMMSNYAVEADEFQFKKCVQERISEIASWHWVLSDLVTRLDDAMASLRHEQKALRVVIQRLKEEINGFSKSKTKPDALCPMSDAVEEAIRKEYIFLKKQKLKFESLTPELDEQMDALENTKKRIQEDCVVKEQAISVEESCAKMDVRSASQVRRRKSSKKKVTNMVQWEKRCQRLKNEGLRALTNAIVIRQQLRGARVELSISAQAHTARVDTALRRRLHSNQVKSQEIIWQRDETARDLQALEEELNNTDKALLDNMEQERLVEARIADRSNRPIGELTEDDAVDRKLKDELMKIRMYNKELRANIDRLTKLQRNLGSAMSKFDCVSDDLSRVISLDEDRINARLGLLPDDHIQSHIRTAPSPPPATPAASSTGVYPDSSNCCSPPCEETRYQEPLAQESNSQSSSIANIYSSSSPEQSSSGQSLGLSSSASVTYDTTLRTIKEEDENIEEEEDDYPFLE